MSDLDAIQAQARNLIALRRTRAVLLLRQGFTQAEIAIQLGVSEGTISLDLKAVRSSLGRVSAEELGAWRAEQLARLAADELALRRLWEQDTAAVRLYDRILAVMAQQERLLGLDLPPQPPDDGQADLDLVLQLLDEEV